MLISLLKPVKLIFVLDREGEDRPWKFSRHIYYMSNQCKIS